MPEVSVIIPSFNRPELVERAVESVINQTLSDIEIIVVDDCSDVDLVTLLTGYKNLKVLRNDRNRGGCYSRNRGISEAKGKYLNFLDDDDILYPEKLEKQLKCFNRSSIPNLGMVTCNVEDGRSGDIIIKKNEVRGNIYKEVLEKFAVSGIESMLFRADYVKEIGGFDEKLQSSQEYDLLIRFTEKYSVDFVDEILTKEFRSVNQISTNFDKKIQGAKYLYQKHDSRYRSIGVFFWLKMRIKLQLLLLRCYSGKLFGEKFYRRLIR
jgi:glycosyltransferase involved in cell wall biosynthesis